MKLVHCSQSCPTTPSGHWFSSSKPLSVVLVAFQEKCQALSHCTFECSANLCLNFLNSHKADAVTQRLGSSTALCANPIPSGTDLFLSCVYKKQKSLGSIENWCHDGEGEEEGKRTTCNGLGRTPLAFLALLPRLVTDLLQYRAATFFFFWP